jgi:hypothetical protein
LALATTAHAQTTDTSEASALPESSQNERFETLWLRGQVDWLADVLKRRFDVQTVDEARQRTLALETADGEVYPLVEDIRGRGFRRDERLRNIPLEVFVRKYRGSPALQVIRVLEIRKDGKYVVDYWCDICAIEMYELKPCDCCQGAIELRHRKISRDKP